MHAFLTPFKDSLSPAEKLAAYHLMLDNTMTYDAIDGEKGETLFKRKPAQEVKDIHALLECARTKGSKKEPRHAAFLDKCRRRIRAARKGVSSSKSTEQENTSESAFTETDRPFLNAVFRGLSSVPKYPCFYKHFSTFFILQQLVPLYPPKPGDSALIDFVKEIGVVAPWENPVKLLHAGKEVTGHYFVATEDSQESALIDDEMAQKWADRLLKEGIFELGAPGARPQKNKAPEKELKQTETKEKFDYDKVGSLLEERLSKIGVKEVEKITSESYSSDLCESIRHDFGDLPGNLHYPCLGLAWDLIYLLIIP